MHDRLGTKLVQPFFDHYASPIRCEFIGSVTIITLSDRVPATKQRRRLLRLMKRIPFSRNRLILDISTIDDDDCGLPRLVASFADFAQQCRFDSCIAGISRPQEALLELTRVSTVVRSFRCRQDAICDMLVDASRRERR